MTVLDKYFELSDRASFDEAAFNELVNLFADRAEVQPAGGNKVVGRAQIEALYKMFSRCMVAFSMSGLQKKQKMD